MLIAARRILATLGVLATVSILGAPVAAADTADPLSTGNDCAKGCIDCQKDCHESRCMTMCSYQWAGCCMTAGLKPPTPGGCACTRG